MKDTLFISDTHFPYQHPDTFKFLRALHKKHKFKVIKHVGDVIDNHTGNFHELEYGCLSPKDEYLEARKCVQKLAKMFPKMTVVLGNHDIMTFRKAKVAGIPEDHLKSYNDVYGVNWNWVDKDYFQVDKYNKCLLIHSMGANTLSNARNHSHHSVQGHHHGRFGIEYFGDTEVLRWSMSVGCLIDPTHPAFNYASRSTLNRQIIGCGSVINNEPRLHRMQLKSDGRWDGKV